MDIAPFKKLIKRHCGLRFDENTESLLLKALQQRLVAAARQDLADYYRYVQHDPHELQELVSLLTINETYFFREAEQLEFLVARLIPRLLARNSDGQPIHILSAGCSSGEEPYSIAIALQEKYGENIARLFRLSAGDIDKTALAKARTARYSAYSFRNLSAELRERYFDCHDTKTWQVKKYLRDRVKFHPLNLLNPALPPELAQFDVIFFRNVSIYFDIATRRLIQHNLTKLLKKDGYLLVGSSETLGNDVGILSLLEEDGLFYFTDKANALVSLPPTPLPQHFDISDTFALTLPSPRGRGFLNSTTLNSEQRTENVTHRLPNDTGCSLSGVEANTGFDSAQPATDPAQPVGSAVQPAARSIQPADFPQALHLTREKRYDEALHSIAQWLQQSPDEPKALLLKAHILLNRKAFAAADAIAQQVLEQDAWSIDACLLRALAAKWRDQTEMAIKYFKQAVYACHTCWPAHYYLAEIYRAEQQMEKARRGYRIVLQLLSTQAEPNAGLAVIPLDLPSSQVHFLCEHHLAQMDAKPVAVALR